jgi:putative addiction module CopG family antidote
MTIHLSKELERFVHEAVRTGHYAREDDVIRDALTRLRETMPENTAKPDQRVKRAKPKTKPLTMEELHQKMLASGLISQLPDTDADFDDPDDQLIDVKGEPLSETIIRERR